MPGQECQLCGEGGLAAARRGHEGAGGRFALFPGNAAGSELSGAVAWKDCSGQTQVQGASPQEALPTSIGRMGKLRLPEASESQWLSGIRTQDPNPENLL